MSLTLGKKLKSRLQDDKTVFGAWVGIPHSSVIELMARAEFGFLLLDGEHTPIDVGSLGSLLPSAELHGAPTVFRPSSQSVADVKRALDAGVSGLMIPMVETAEQARTIVSYCRYPPDGGRGIGPWRASGYYEDFDTYLAEANDAITLLLQVESAKGLANLDEILAVRGFDVLYVGPADLASSLDLPIGQFDGKMRNVLEQVAAATLRAGKTAAIDAPSVSVIPDLVAMGYSLFTIGSDMGFIQTSARCLVSELTVISARRNC